MRLITLIFSIALMGCASTTYHVEVGGRYDDFVDNFTDISLESKLLSNNLTILSGDSSKFSAPGKGAHIALVETTKITYARIGVFYVDHDKQSYTFNSPSTGTFTENIGLNTQGVEMHMGFNIWYFRPYLALNYLVMTYDTENPVLNYPYGHKSYYYFGGGLAIDIPITDSVHILINGQYQLKSYGYSIGLMFGGWKTGGSDSGGSSSRRRR